MSVTKNSRSIGMTASGDALAGKILVDSMTFEGTGLTVGQVLTVAETGGQVIALIMVTAVTMQVEALSLPSPKWIDGIVLSGTVAGTWALMTIYR